MQGDRSDDQNLVVDIERNNGDYGWVTQWVFFKELETSITDCRQHDD